MSIANELCKYVNAEFQSFAYWSLKDLQLFIPSTIPSKTGLNINRRQSMVSPRAQSRDIIFRVLSRLII